LYFILDFAPGRFFTSAYLMDARDAATQVLIHAAQHVRGDGTWPNEIRIATQESIAKAESKIYG
jgi:hypothetical protein